MVNMALRNLSLSTKRGFQEIFRHIKLNPNVAHLLRNHHIFCSRCIYKCLDGLVTKIIDSTDCSVWTLLSYQITMHTSLYPEIFQNSVCFALQFVSAVSVFHVHNRPLMKARNDPWLHSFPAFQDIQTCIWWGEKPWPKQSTGTRKRCSFPNHKN